MRRLVRPSVIVILILGAVAAYAARERRDSLSLSTGDLAEVAERLAAIPLKIERPVFTGTRDVLQDRIVELSGAEHYAAIDYRAPDGGSVRLHLGAASRSDAWLHEPKTCLPAHGWQTSERVRVPIWPGLAGVEDGSRIWRMTLKKTEAGMLVYYWFQYGSRVITSKSERRWLRFKDLVQGRRDRPTHIVILYAPVEAGLDRSESRIASLVRVLWPHLSAVFSSGD